jgi:large subunit ribosomal protein L15
MLNTLAPSPFSRKKSKRRGRGDSSGRGSFSGRGCKGQNSRAGTKFRPGFEGNQTPLAQRLPQLRGFNNINRVEYQVVNLSEIESLGMEKVTVADLKKHGLIRSINKKVKLLGQGTISKKVTLEVHAASQTAKAGLEKAGGSLSIIA